MERYRHPRDAAVLASQYFDKLAFHFEPISGDGKAENMLDWNGTIMLRGNCDAILLKFHVKLRYHVSLTFCQFRGGQQFSVTLLKKCVVSRLVS